MELLVLIYVLQCSLLAVHCCPPLCVCVSGANGTDGDLRWVRCSDPAIAAVPADLPADTVKLRLEKTSVSAVPRGAFSGLGRLRYLWLSYNAIRSVRRGSLLGLGALRELRLDGNLLTSFPWAALRATPALRTLALHNNRLSTLPARAARFLCNVTYLDLSSNRLTRLPAEMLALWFPLAPGQLSGRLQCRVLGLHDNPWLCDCQISAVTALSAALRSPVVLVDRRVTCSGTPQGGQQQQGSDPARLPCTAGPSVRPAAARVTSPLGSNVALRCDATGYPTPTLTWTKTTNSSVYAHCCQQAGTTEDSQQLPKELEVFMQESPGVGVRWSVLSLNGLTYDDAGEYRCHARNMAGRAEAPIDLRVVGVITGSLSPAAQSKKTPCGSSSPAVQSQKTPGGAASSTVQSQKTPGGSASRTVQSQKTPAGSASSAVQSQKTPGGSSSRTVQSQKTPTGSSSRTVQSQKTPAGSASSAVQSQKTPGGSTSSTVQSQMTPGESTSSMVQSQKTPAGSSSSTVQSQKTPARSTSPTVQSQKTPAGSASPTVQSQKTPAGSASSAVQSLKTPAGSASSTVQSLKTPAGSSSSTVQSQKTPARSTLKRRKQKVAPRPKPTVSSAPSTSDPTGLLLLSVRTSTLMNKTRTSDPT